MSTYQDPADILAEHCESDHDRRDADCANCDIRADIQHCANCDADYVDGKWWTGLGTTRPNGCDHTVLLNDWGQELVCETVTCADEVTTAGRTHCDFHQRWIDAAECDRVYQALVASPPAVSLEIVR